MFFLLFSISTYSLCTSHCSFSCLWQYRFMKPFVHIEEIMYFFSLANLTFPILS